MSAYYVGNPGSIPGSGRSLREGNSNPLQCSCLENPIDRGDWWSTANGFAELDRTEELAQHLAFAVCLVVMLNASQELWKILQL